MRIGRTMKRVILWKEFINNPDEIAWHSCMNRIFFFHPSCIKARYQNRFPMGLVALTPFYLAERFEDNRFLALFDARQVTTIVSKTKEISMLSSERNALLIKRKEKIISFFCLTSRILKRDVRQYVVGCNVSRYSSYPTLLGLLYLPLGFLHWSRNLFAVALVDNFIVDFLAYYPENQWLRLFNRLHGFDKGLRWKEGIFVLSFSELFSRKNDKLVFPLDAIQWASFVEKCLEERLDQERLIRDTWDRINCYSPSLSCVELLKLRFEGMKLLMKDDVYSDRILSRRKRAETRRRLNEFVRFYNELRLENRTSASKIPAWPLWVLTITTFIKNLRKKSGI